MAPKTTLEPVGTGIFDSVVRICAKFPDGQLQFVGTGITLGGNLVLTARHVVTEISEKYGTSAAHTPDSVSGVEVLLAQTASDASGKLTCNLFAAIESIAHPKTDIALLVSSIMSFTDMPLRELKRSKLRCVPPRVGEKIRGFGFPYSEATYSPDDSGGVLEFRDSPRWAEGEVIAVHEWYRDEGFYSFPVFETDAEFDSGMSGGPVFDTDGNVCGIICGSLPPTQPGEFYASYASSIWPFLGWKVPLRLETGQVGDQVVEMVEFARRGVIDVIDLSELSPYLKKINATKPSKRNV